MQASANAFEDWRYASEKAGNLDAIIVEMRCAS
jgi:hypothetical protein